MITNMYEVKCDNKKCDNKSYYPTESVKFKDLIEIIKNDMWFMYYNNEKGRYEQYCEECSQKFL